MKKLILPVVIVLLCGAIAWPYLFGGATVEVKGKTYAVEHRTVDEGAKSRKWPLARRGALEKGTAVLCSWDRDRYLHFWSDGCTVSFDVVFLDASGKVLEIARVRPFRANETLNDPGVSSTVEARRALFLPEGATDDPRLSVGDPVTLSSDLLDARTEAMTQVKVAGETLRVEISDSLLMRARGLMHRPKMSKDEGMLFLYRKPTTGLSYYMRNTMMSLDIAYFDGAGKLVNAKSAERAGNPATEGSSVHAPADGAAQYVLEVPLGWFRERNLVDGAGKPAKDVLMEIPDEIRKRAAVSEEQR